MASLLAPGVKAPAYALVRPPSAPSNALWAGTSQPGSNWKGVGGGWWVPPSGYTAPTINPGGPIQRTSAPVSGGNPGSAVANLSGAIAGAKAQPSPSNPTTYSATTTTAPPPAPDPRDMTYWQNVNTNNATVGNQIAGYQRQIADLNTTAAQSNYLDPVNNPVLARQYGTDLLAQQIAAHGRGALYSTALDQALEGVTGGYAQRYTNALGTAKTGVDQLAVDIVNAQGAGGQYAGDQLTAAIGRQLQANASDPTLGGVAPVTPAGAMAPPTIQTNPGGAFYQWYVRAYGKPPPAAVSPNSARYVAWRTGTPIAKAKSIPFGSVAK